VNCAIEERVQILTPSLADCRSSDSIFKKHVPANDERHQLAHANVAVNIESWLHMSSMYCRHPANQLKKFLKNCFSKNAYQRIGLLIGHVMLCWCYVTAASDVWAGIYIEVAGCKFGYGAWMIGCWSTSTPRPRTTLDGRTTYSRQCSIRWVGFKIVWSVLYEHREYNHSRLF